MELIYSRRRSGFETGKHYRNPRFFDRPEHGAESVIIEGEEPVVAAAYEAVGIPIKRTAQAPQAEPAPKAQPEPEKAAESDSKPKRGRPRKTQE